MKTHTSDYKQQIKLLGRQIDSKITYEINGVTQTLTSEQLNSVTPTFQGAILKSVMKELDVDSNVDIPLGTIVNYKFGVLVNGAYEYLNYGNYVVYSSEKQEDTSSYKIVCYDKMLCSMKQNEDLGVTYPISIRDYINALCTKIGLEFKNKNSEFANYDKVIDKELYVGLDYTYRDIFDELAQVTASTIYINEEDKVEIKYISDVAVDTIDEDYLKDCNINFGKKYGPINSIVLNRGESDNVYLRDEKSVSVNGLCEIKIKENQIMNWNDRSDYLPDILEKLNGLTYYLNDFVSTGITYYDVCDRYNVKIDEKVYSCVIFNDEIQITQGLIENIHTDMPEETETDYKKADKTDRRINSVSISVDKIQKEIDLLNQKVVNLSATVTGINKLELTECSNTPLYKLIISGDDDLLFPNTKLFPGATTYLKNSFLYVNRGTDDEDTYNLGITSLRTLGTIKDEFILENGKATLIKRIGLNDSLEKYVLDEPVIKDLGSLSVNLKEGNNTIELPSFPSFRLTATYLLKNQYTDTFATQASVTNQIKVAQDEILIESKSQILESGDELIASINTTSTGNIKIKASDTISLEGAISANGNFKIDGKGNAIMNSAKITGGDITLPEGGKVVGGDGMMSVMIVNASIWSSQFLGGQGFMPMGFEGISSQGYAISQMLDFVIPENFKPRKAFIYLKHIPLTSKGYFDTQTEQSYTGYARNVKAYLCSDGSSSRSINYSIGPPTIEGNYTEIPKAFGVNGFTGSATELKEKTSIDISNYIKNPGTYSIQLKSSMTAPTAYKTIYEATGCLLAQLYIYGYTSEQIE